MSNAWSKTKKQFKYEEKSYNPDEKDALTDKSASIPRNVACDIDKAFPCILTENLTLTNRDLWKKCERFYETFFKLNSDESFKSI